MINRLLKKLIVLAFLMLASADAIAQPRSCTKEMASKIAFFLETEKFGYGTFYLKANRDETKALQYLKDLPNHIDYADNFIIEVIKYYGVRSSYEVMATGMKFTTDECIIAKEIYEQYVEREKVKQKEQGDKKEADERKLQAEIENGKVLSQEEVTFLPQLRANISADSFFRRWNRIEVWKQDRQVSFVVEVSADKEIRLVEGNRELFDALQIEANTPAYKQFDGLKSRMPCACRLDIKLKTAERNYRKIEEPIYYDKKKGWYATPKMVMAGDKRIFGYNIYEKNEDLDEIYRQLSELGNNGKLKQGLCRVQIYKRTLTLYVGDKVIQTGEIPNSVQIEFITK